MSDLCFLGLVIVVVLLSIGGGIFISEWNRKKLKQKQAEENLKGVLSLVQSGIVHVATEEECCAGTQNDKPFNPMFISKLMRDFDASRVRSLHEQKPGGFE